MTHFPILNICLWLDLAISSPSNLARELFTTFFPHRKEVEMQRKPESLVRRLTLREKTDTSPCALHNKDDNDTLPCALPTSRLTLCPVLSPHSDMWHR